MSKIKVVVAGVGNCCSALVQSIHYHAENPRGLMNYDLGGFKPSDIQVVGGIDIDSRKVGRDLSEPFLPSRMSLQSSATRLRQESL